jgi:hypothetical protein
MRVWHGPFLIKRRLLLISVILEEPDMLDRSLEAEFELSKTLSTDEPDVHSTNGLTPPESARRRLCAGYVDALKDASRRRG